MANVTESALLQYVSARKLAKAFLLAVNPSVLLPIMIFVVVWASFVALRLRFEVILTDTDFYMTGPRAFSWEYLRYIWHDTPPAWYRPVDTALSYLLLAFLWKNFSVAIPLQMLVPAASAVFLYLIADDLSGGNKFLAVAAALIYSFSLGVIEVSWLFVHKSIVVDLLVLCAVLGYLRYVRTHRLGWFLLMIFGSLTAPWAREIGASVAPALLAAALLKKWRDVKLVVTLALLAFHGVFTGFLTNLLFFREISLTPIFTRSSWGLGIPFGSLLTLDVPFKVVIFLSPIATILMLTSVILYYHGCGRRAATLLVGAISLLSLAGLFYPQKTALTIIMPLIFAAMMVVVNLPKSKLLPIWFVCSMAPFIIMPTHDAWLRLSATPYVIMTLFWISDLPANLSLALNRFRGPTRGYAGVVPRVDVSGGMPSLLVRAVIALLVLIAANNLIISFETFRVTIAQNKNMAAWVTTTIPEGAALVSSVRLLPEVQYYSNDWIDARYLRLPFTFPLPGGMSPHLGSLDAITISHSSRGVYFMVNEKYGRVGYPAGVSDDELTALKTFVVSAKYPMLDPFQAIMPKHYRRFGGPTDTLHEFRLIHNLFRGEALAVFRFYRLDRRPQIVERGYRGFDLYKWGNMYFGAIQSKPFVPQDMLGSKHAVTGFGYSREAAKESIDQIVRRTRDFTVKKFLWDIYAGYDIYYVDRHFYGIPRSEGVFNLSRYRAGRYTEAFDAGSPGLVKLQIDDMYLTGIPPGMPHNYHPSLMSRDYKGFSIYFFRERIYGIPRVETPFEYERFAREEYAAVVGPFRAGAETVIWHIDTGRYDLRPRVIAQGFHGYNLVAYGSKIYAIRQKDGEFDYARFSRDGYSGAFVGAFVDQVKDSVLRHVSQTTAAFVEEYAGFTISAYRGLYYATHNRQGEVITASKLEAAHYTPLLRGDSVEDVRVLIAEYTLAKAPMTALYDDAEQAWSTESGLTASTERRIVKLGSTSLKVTWTNSRGSVYYNFPARQDWSKARMVGFYVYGAGSGESFALQTRFGDRGGPNWVDFRWRDDFVGWQPVLFELSEPATTSGVIDWTSVTQVLVRPLGTKGITLYLDRLVRDGVEPILVRADYLGFNITQLDSWYYATRVQEGKFDFGKLRERRYSVIIGDVSVDRVAARIIAYTLQKHKAVVLYDEDSLVWQTEPGVEIAQQAEIARVGKRSLKMSWNNSAAAVYYNFPTRQDWSPSKHLILWVRGAGTGASFALQVRFKDQGGPNWVEFRWKDDFRGWKPLAFELGKPNATSGTQNWTDVRQVLIRPLQDGTMILYIDYLVRS